MSSEVDPGARAALARWVREDALPLWAETGWDRINGGFVECLDPLGAPLASAPRRVRVQARQVYVYAHAACLGLWKPAKDKAIEGFEWLTAKCKRPGQPGFVRLVAHDGEILDHSIEAYDQAFGLLALAWMFRLTGDSAIRAAIDREIQFLDDKFLDRENGGWHEDVANTLPRNQNPQMHALEAMLALFEATGDGEFLARAKAFGRLFEERLFDHARGCLVESFDDVWRPVGAGDVVWPGHHFEWAWLLNRLDGHLARSSTLPLKLYRWGCLHGVDPRGFAIDEVSPSGEALKSSKRLWPQTELLKASLALGCEGEDCAEHGSLALRNLLHCYLSKSVPGGWVDRLDQADQVLEGHMPASSFYHIFCAAAELMNRAGRPLPVEAA